MLENGKKAEKMAKGDFEVGKANKRLGVNGKQENLLRKHKKTEYSY